MSQTILVRYREVEVVAALRVIPIIVLIASLVVSCEPAPAELHLWTAYRGVFKGCTVMIFNSRGTQFMEINTNSAGYGFVDAIKPGVITIRFKDAKGAMYPAVSKLKLAPLSVHVLNVELAKKTQPPG